MCKLTHATASVKSLSLSRTAMGPQNLIPIAQAGMAPTAGNDSTPSKNHIPNGYVCRTNKDVIYMMKKKYLIQRATIGYIPPTATTSKRAFRPTVCIASSELCKMWCTTVPHFTVLHRKNNHIHVILVRWRYGEIIIYNNIIPARTAVWIANTINLNSRGKFAKSTSRWSLHKNLET